MSDRKTCLRINGQPIEVTQEVYDLYTKSERKMRYFEEDLKRETLVKDARGNLVIVSSREDSLERLTEENAQQFAEDTPSVEDLVIRKMRIETLHKPCSTANIVRGLFHSKNLENYICDSSNTFPLLWRTKAKALTAAAR